MKKLLAITFLGSWLLWVPSLLSSAEIAVPGFLLAIGMLIGFGVLFMTGIVIAMIFGKHLTKNRTISEIQSQQGMCDNKYDCFSINMS